jgi:hypothetical protein
LAQSFSPPSGPPGLWTHQSAQAQPTIISSPSSHHAQHRRLFCTTSYAKRRHALPASRPPRPSPSLKRSPDRLLSPFTLETSAQRPIARNGWSIETPLLPVTASPPLHRLLDLYKGAPALVSPPPSSTPLPFPFSSPQACHHRAHLAAAFLYHRLAIRTPPLPRANRGRALRPLLLLPMPLRRGPTHGNAGAHLLR